MSGWPGWTVGVVVPARDEADHIGSCLASVRASLEAAGRPSAPIVVVADSCRDDTAERARAAIGPCGTVIEVAAGSVGLARRLGTERLLVDLAPEAELERTWICATDADTAVPLDWVLRHLRLADGGAAAVAGTVRVDSFHEHPPWVEVRYHRRYTDGLTSVAGGLERSHPHVHGANLGVRADAYVTVGGWSALTTAEDHDLWQRLQAGGWPTTSSYDTWVTTSGRAVGRAPDGFAGHLEGLAAS